MCPTWHLAALPAARGSSAAARTPRWSEASPCPTGSASARRWTWCGYCAAVVGCDTLGNAAAVAASNPGAVGSPAAAVDGAAVVGCSGILARSCSVGRGEGGGF